MAYINGQEVNDSLFVAAQAIDDGAVTTAKLADEAVTTEKLKYGAITNDKIAAGAVQLQNIQGIVIAIDADNPRMNKIPTEAAIVAYVQSVIASLNNS